MPLVWYGGAVNGTPIVSPGAPERRSFYGIPNSAPQSYVGGTIYQIGGINYNTYLTQYNQVMNSNTSSPIQMEVNLGMNSQGGLSVFTNVTITDNLTTTNNRIYFIIIHDGPGRSRFQVMRAAFDTFTQSEVGSSELYVHDFLLDPNWNIEYLKAVSIVQSNQGTNRAVIQAGISSGMEAVVPNFTSDVVSGPPILEVNFRNNSFSTFDIISRQWDFNDDGTIDSTEDNPTWLFEEPGTYTVSLTIETENGFETMRKVDYITVLNSDDVSGKVQGRWTAEFSPYIITDDIEIPVSGTLHIEKGVTLSIGQGLNIVVNGILIAEGEKDHEIIFSSEETWRGLNFQFSQQTSYLKYVIVEKATNTAIRVNLANIEIENSIIRNNTSANSGAAIHLQSSPSSHILNTYIVNNHSTNNAGAINITGSTVNIENALIVNNTGRTSIISVLSSSNTNITNCTIYNNHTTTAPGGTIFNSNSIANLTNSIIDGTQAVFNLNATTNATYSRIIGVIGDGNITDEPLFRNVPDGRGHEFETSFSDWVLMTDSPCIDAGNPADMYFDIEDPNNLGFAKYPSRGTLRNDMGVYGGQGGNDFTVSENNKIEIPNPNNISINAFPNPFNPSVSLNVSIDNVDVPLNISIYNIRGQKVNELMNSIPDSNNFTIQWNGNDFSGLSASSGIYFIRAVSGQNINTSKVLLMK